MYTVSSTSSTLVVGGIVKIYVPKRLIYVLILTDANDYSTNGKTFSAGFHNAAEGLRVPGSTRCEQSTWAQ